MGLGRGSKMREVKSPIVRSIPDLLRGSLVATEFDESVDWVKGQVTLKTETTEFKRLHNTSLSRRGQFGDRRLGARRSLTLHSKHVVLQNSVGRTTGLLGGVQRRIGHMAK